VSATTNLTLNHINVSAFHKHSPNHRTFTACFLEMASAPGDLRSQLPALERQVKQLLNNDLKDICRKEGLQISGVKSVLQGRVLDRKTFLLDRPRQAIIIDLYLPQNLGT